MREGGDALFEVWPENARAFGLFAQLTTQWNVGFGGYVGLRYEAAYPLLDREADSPQDWRELFDALREIEYGALGELNKKD